MGKEMYPIDLSRECGELKYCQCFALCRLVRVKLGIPDAIDDKGCGLSLLPIGESLRGYCRNHEGLQGEE